MAMFDQDFIDNNDVDEIMFDCIFFDASHPEEQKEGIRKLNNLKRKAGNFSICVTQSSGENKSGPQFAPEHYVCYHIAYIPKNIEEDDDNNDDIEDDDGINDENEMFR
jgi:hypothetical protein